MHTRETIIQAYIDGYNQFDVDKMVAHLDEQIIFENQQGGVVNMSLQGLEAFRQQAELAKSYFSERKQTIKAFRHTDTITEIDIEYVAVLAMDFPNGMQKGQKLSLTGKSVFTFSSDKVVKLVDIS